MEGIASMKTLCGEEIASSKKRMQAIFTDGLVTVVGSGLSAAEGIPGMASLADYLVANVPLSVLPADEDAWAKVKERLDAGDGLEVALHKVTVSDALEDLIVRLTAELILQHETRVLNECLTTDRELRFSKLLPYLSPSNPKVVHVVTTNYDRLLECAIERAGWGVDTMTVGRYWGTHQPSLSDKSFVKTVVSRTGKGVSLQYRDRVKLYKPHGSLDWYATQRGVVTTVLPLTAPRLIITPGVGKYRRGYSQPFDSHREQANAAIDKASHFLCIGYGFNDDHLQTHLKTRLQEGVKGLLLVRSLSDSARDFLKSCPGLVAASCSEESSSPGTILSTREGDALVPGTDWWDVNGFVQGVLSA